jgi:hypothetical protein
LKVTKIFPTPLVRHELPGTIILKEPVRFTKRRQRKKTLEKIIKAELVAAGVLGAGLTGLAAPAALKLLATRLLAAGGSVLKLAAKHPGKTLLAAGLASTKGGRKFLQKLPETIFRGGRVAGKVIGGEETGLNVKKALLTAGLVGAGAVAGKKIFDVVTGRGKKEAPSLPGAKDVGAAPGRPVGVGGIPLSQTAPPGAPGAPGKQIRGPPIQNIIQIAVR